MQSCYQCGAQAEADDQFCGNCGIAQPVPPPLTEKKEERPVSSPVTVAPPVWSEPPRPVQPFDTLSQFNPGVALPIETPLPANTFDRQPSSSPSVTPVPEQLQPAQPQTAAFEVINDDPPTLTSAPLPGISQPPSAELISENFSANLPPKDSHQLPESIDAAPPVMARTPAARVETPAVEETDPELQATIIGRPPAFSSSPKATSAAEPLAENRREAVVSKPVAQPPVDVASVTGDKRSFDAERNSDAVSRPINHSSNSGARTGGTMNGDRRTAPKNLEAGLLLNSRYEIVRRIGGGGMGAVYLAKDRNLGDAPRAVKEMIQSQMDEAQQEKAINDFKRESLLLTSLEHNSIPTIYDYFFDDDGGRFYLVMKYISGGDLLTRLRNAPGGRIDEKTVAAWGVEIADVLEYLHTRRPPIIYRDLKPANLMIDGNSGRIMLIDFGIARWVGVQEKGVTAVGTMGYAPPELFSGKVEPRSDVYSLGATMFHLLTGSDPQDNPLLIFDFNKHPRPRQLNPALSHEMERILMRAVEYKPEDRFASAGELRDTLAQHLKDLSANRVNFGSPVTAPDHSIGQTSGQTSATEMVFCGFCGGRIAGNDLFCAYCGARQPLAGASAALQRPSRTTAKLVVASTSELNASFALQKESNLVGRSDPNSNIFPEIDLSRFDPNTKISRRHARIWREGDSFLVEDLGSINGTVLNDAVRLAPRQPRVLASGDRLRLGETTLHFLVG